VLVVIALESEEIKIEESKSGGTETVRHRIYISLSMKGRVVK
jgi:hypothetical protein